MSESRETRSRIMRAVRGADTAPEIAVRRMLRSLGFSGYRLRRKDLPGSPDIAFIGRRKAIFVHGCFWHGHDCARGARVPKSNKEYWLAKISRNRERDMASLFTLNAMGWGSLVLWECELRNSSSVESRLKNFLRVIA
ncbi:MAG: very short patch repair endonuclease [Fluviibacter sp.]